MKRIKIITLIMIAIMILFGANVYATNAQLTLTGASEAKAGETGKVSLNLVSSEEAIGVVSGTLKFSDNISTLKMSGKNDWSVTYNKSTGEFNILKAEGAKNETIAEIEYTLKPDTTTSANISIEGNVLLTTINYNNIKLSSINKEIKISKKDEQPKEDINNKVDNKTDKDNKNDNSQNNSGIDNSNNNSNNNTNNSNNSTNNNSNNSTNNNSNNNNNNNTSNNNNSNGNSNINNSSNNNSSNGNSNIDNPSNNKTNNNSSSNGNSSNNNNGNNSQNTKKPTSQEKKDTATGRLPEAGLTRIRRCIAIVITAVIAIVSYKLYKKYKKLGKI